AVFVADPEYFRIERRLGEGRDLAETGLAVVARDADVAPAHTHHWDGVAIHLSREIRRGRPRRATVFRDEELVGGDVHRSRRVARREERRVPIPAVRRVALGRLRLDVEAVAGDGVEALDVAAA